MKNFVETEETKQQLEVLKNKRSKVAEMLRTTEKLLAEIQQELWILDTCIEDYKGLKLLWSE